MFAERRTSKWESRSLRNVTENVGIDLARFPCKHFATSREVPPGRRDLLKSDDTSPFGMECRVLANDEHPGETSAKTSVDSFLPFSQ